MAFGQLVLREQRVLQARELYRLAHLVAYLVPRVQLVLPQVAQLEQQVLGQLRVLGQLALEQPLDLVLGLRVVVGHP